MSSDVTTRVLALSGYRRERCAEAGPGSRFVGHESYVHVALRALDALRWRLRRSREWADQWRLGTVAVVQVDDVAARFGTEEVEVEHHQLRASQLLLGSTREKYVESYAKEYQSLNRCSYKHVETRRI